MLRSIYSLIYARQLCIHPSYHSSKNCLFSESISLAISDYEFAVAMADNDSKKTVVH